MDDLTTKQAAFVAEYLKDMNGTQAAIRAGYAPSAAGQQACVLLKNPKVKAAVQAAKAQRSERTAITADRVLEELARLAFADPSKCYDDAGNLLPVPKMPPEARASLSGVDVEEGESSSTRKVKRWDKVKALELLGKHLGMWQDKVKVSGDTEEPLRIEVVTLKQEGT